ncbi:MAG: hypothetical protein ACK5SP_02100 [bacterium]|jgi:hypothetical protein
MNDYITFTSATVKEPSETITLTIHTTSLPEVVGAFERFLRGAGYHFEGNLEIVQDIDIKEPQYNNDCWGGACKRI